MGRVTVTVTDAGGNEAVATADYTVTDSLPQSPFPVGVSISNKGNRGGLTGWPAHRIYIIGNCPASILDHADIQLAIREGVCRYIYLSWKDTDTARVSRMLDSVKRDLVDARGWTVDTGYFHEMEDNMSGAQFLPVARAHHLLASNRGLKFGPMYQAWTMNPKSNRNWRDWWDNRFDLFGIEAYNPGRKKNPPIFEPPAQFLDRAFDALREAGKPTVVGEFGMPVDPRSAATRPAYIRSIVDYYRDRCPVPVRALLYWDSMATNDNRLDRTAAEALKSMNL